MTPESEDLQRLRGEYAERKRRLAGNNLYSCFNPANLFILQGRQRAVLSALQRNGINTLSEQRVLEMGCGSGGVLLELLSFGAKPAELAGIDLLFDRLAEAKPRLPGCGLACADGQTMPFADQTFNIVLQFTALSSILSDALRERIAAEMLRVLKRDGLILSYDFWWNPLNRQTRGLSPAELRRLFPGCLFQFERVTLAPPLVRRLVPGAWGLAHLLETVKIFNSHYLAIIRPQER